jgi:hypothetical protein
MFYFINFLGICQHCVIYHGNGLKIFKIIKLKRFTLTHVSLASEKRG